MNLVFTPTEMDALVTRLALVHTQRMLTVLDGVPMENRQEELMTDAGHRQRMIKQLVEKAEREHPLPDWRNLL